MAITDTLNLNPEMVAEQNPELHQMRKIAFGENYLQDIEQGTGTSQYYSGWGNVPHWAQQAMTTDEAYTTPAVTGTTTNIGVGGGPDAGIMSVAPTAGAVSGMPGSMPTVPAGGMEGGVWGPMDYLQPPLDQAGAVAAMTQPEAYNIPGTMPLTPVSGAWGPMDYLQQPQTIIQDPMAGDAAVAEAIAAQDRQEQAIQAPETTYPIAGLSTDQKAQMTAAQTTGIADPNNPGKDIYGKNIVSAFGDYEKSLEGTKATIEKTAEKKGGVDKLAPNLQEKLAKVTETLNIIQSEKQTPTVTTAVAPPSILAPAPVYHAPIAGGGGNGGGGGGYSGDPGGGTAGSPFAKGGLIRKQYGSGGIVDLL